MDRIEKYGNLIVQHGKSSNRIYVMHYDDCERERMFSSLPLLAKENGYDKVIVKIPATLYELFIDQGYVKEATIESYFSSGEDCFMMSLFLSDERANSADLTLCREILDQLDMAKSKRNLPKLEEGFTIMKLNKEYAAEMASVFANVFSSYPFPVFNPTYICETMESNVLYFGILDNDKLVAISSSEMDVENRNAEMTDFAILPEYRGKHFSKHLLRMMEQEMEKLGVRTLYTIARALSLPMNAVFRGMNYQYGGMMINNTQIARQIENMNIWYKKR